jgi:hypothetical protein
VCPSLPRVRGAADPAFEPSESVGDARQLMPSAVQGGGSLELRFVEFRSAEGLRPYVL